MLDLINAACQLKAHSFTFPTVPYDRVYNFNHLGKNIGKKGSVLSKVKAKHETGTT
jgi:hypothetical protein